MADKEKDDDLGEPLPRPSTAELDDLRTLMGAPHVHAGFKDAMDDEKTPNPLEYEQARAGALRSQQPSVGAEDLDGDEDSDPDHSGPYMARTVIPLSKRFDLWNQTLTLAALPTQPCALSKIVIPSHLARFFQIVQVSVGADLLVGPIMGEIFADPAYALPLNARVLPGAPIRIEVRSVRPRKPLSFTIAWWVHWFTREGWRDRPRRRPPEFSAALILTILEE